LRDHPLASVARRWLTELQECVRTVDYARARPLFDVDVVSFGTHASVVSGREALERDQWQHVWPNIREFTFRLDELHCIGDEQHLVAIAPWHSLGIAPDGAPFPRPGRATVALARKDGRWVAVHTHFSLVPRR
jgi:ketosteroid isomerase-like protein